MNSAWQAMTGSPVRFLMSRWPWRALAYLLLNLPGGVVALLLIIVDDPPWTGAVLLTAAAVPAAFAGSMPVAALERWRLRLVDSASATSPHQPLVRPWRSWLVARGMAPATWREAGYLLLYVTVLPLATVIAVGAIVSVVSATLVSTARWYSGGEPIQLGAGLQASAPVSVAGLTIGLLTVGVVGGAYLLTALAAGQGMLARGLVTAPANGRVAELTRSRERLVDAFEVERRRIERDLHDGSQLRLTAVLMHLGLARLDVHSDRSPVAASIDAAYENAQAALDELRAVFRGIHPQTLTSRGFAAAAAEAARHCPVHVETDIDVRDRPPRAAESAAYFFVSECLTNVVKHSGATKAWLRACRTHGMFAVEIEDNGAGGADPGAGTGLAGLAERLRVVGGELTVNSPAGGPTIVRAAILCPEGRPVSPAAWGG